MVTLTSLWLPILVGGVLVFIVSSILHMVLPLHRSDYSKMAGENELLEAMRKVGVTPGNYMFPHCTGAGMKSPEQKEKWEKGPVGFVNVVPNGPPAMGRALVQWFVYTLVVGVLVAYVTGLTLSPGTDYRMVFRISSTLAFMAYGIGAVSESIWKGQRWSTSLKFVFDGLIYALVTGGVFGWLWPGN